MNTEPHIPPDPTADPTANPAAAPLDAATATSPETPASAADIDAHLRSLASQARAQLLLQRSGLLLAIAIAVTLVWAILDFWLRFPPAIRWIAWTAGLATIAWQARQRLLPAWNFRPNPTALALRIESASPTDAGLRSLLASGLELSHTNDGSQPGPVERSLRTAATRAAGSKFSPARSKTRMLRPDRLLRVFAALVAVAIPVVALRVAQPTLTQIGTLRVLAPWADAAWPKRTGVADAHPSIAHALGSPIALRAVSFRKGGAGADVSVEYRSVLNNEPGPWRRAILSKQSKRITVELPGGGESVEGPLHELLLETASLATPAQARPPAEAFLEYRFRSADDETPLWTTRLIPPPAILSSSVQITPPAYAARCQTALQAQPIPTTLAADGQTEPRIRGGSVLAGSTIAIDLKLNRPMPLPDSETDLAQLIRTTFPAIGEVADLKLLSTSEADDTWTLTWTATNSISTPIALQDTFGIRATTDPVLDVEVTDDRPPQPAIVEPAQDESVLPTAIINVLAESRDDVGVATLELLKQLEKRPADSPGAPAEPQGEPVVDAQALPAEVGCELRIESGSTYDIATLGLEPGDALVLTARSTDLRLASLGEAGIVSAPRRLRIISESTFTEELQNELASMRDAAARLRKEQGDVSAQRPLAAESSKAANESAARQQAVAERIEPLTRLGDRLKARIARNRPEDSSLAQTVNDADELAKEAATSADAAAEALEQLANDDPAQDRAALAERTAQGQSSTEDALDELVAMLERGREGHAAKRTIERLLTEQRQTTAQTANAAAQTQGKSTESLTPAQKQELDRIAAKQQSLSQRTQAALDALEQQAEQLKPSDAGQAQAMKNAAQKGRESRAAGQQQQASQQIQQNQTGQAQESQKKAEESLADMLDELNKTQQRRDDALRRVLAEIAEELERLVANQATELSRASAAIVAPPAAPIDPGMVNLNRSTISLTARINKEMRAAGDLPQLMDSAVSAQSAAIASLRSEPPDFGEAGENEQRALSRLRDAAAELERLQEEAEEKEQDRKRRELLKEYTAALENQVAIKTEVAPFSGKPLARKDRAIFRAAGQMQEALRASLIKMREETSELETAEMFSFAHDRLDSVMADATARLTAGNAEPALDNAQASAVRILASLVDALKPLPEDDDGLKEDEQGGDSGGGGGGGSQEPPLIPPLAELKLLRSMQQEAFELTKDANAAANPDAKAVSQAAELQAALAVRAAEIQKKLEEQPSMQPPDQEAPEVEPQNDKPENADKPGPVPPAYSTPTRPHTQGASPK